MFPNHKDTGTEDAEPYGIKLYCNQPFASSLFTLSCLHASGSRYLSVLAGITSRKMTSARLRLIRVRGRGGYGWEGEVDTSVNLRRTWVSVRTGYRCAFVVNVKQWQSLAELIHIIYI